MRSRRGSTGDPNRYLVLRSSPQQSLPSDASLTFAQSNLGTSGSTIWALDPLFELLDLNHDDANRRVPPWIRRPDDEERIGGTRFGVRGRTGAGRYREPVHGRPGGPDRDLVASGGTGLLTHGLRPR